MLEDCTVEGNGAHGVLSRNGARPAIVRCSISGNAGYGVLLKDGGGVFRDDTLSREPLAAARSVHAEQILRDWAAPGGGSIAPGNPDCQHCMLRLTACTALATCAVRLTRHLWRLPLLAYLTQQEREAVR